MSADRDDLEQFTAEVNGEVSDRPMRSVIDTRTRSFYNAIEREDWDAAKGYLREDAKLVGSLDSPGSIYNGADKVIEYYQYNQEEHESTVVKLLVVDRGRATCYFEAFWIETVYESEVAAKAASKFKRARMVCIFDVDEKYLIRRIEFRDTDQETITTDGSLKEMRDAAKESKKDVVAMKENFGF
ncbi:hypothetical protein HER10_EVM0000327 [Colletotrichum scovillei]|uniref:SnoaL-like domain-containing protein n=1 Tax=Colletotrichum scovillei TaxID=1209932 RepID=A0A9P7UFZ2_9PEZI|nr:uncharacterized protein HER10_EVM0000327 [Colletotrichum scovillei]KAF4775745.1 hypothetical protein HER10_EVM0000327 [Colletotrichum scovillei]KAG7047260.1 hypothetical protein JMJ77_0010614 [Colletotrichum scovillei]KAG7059611.1 hypothetical protein JMJ78_0014901 [Colletotrichum scovillei]KAG7067025.1 hypothetical protein JMJ76_0008470 [Colletotrichum scovillei]